MADILVADLFCGAGGSSTGARRALKTLGLRMDLVAVNHWDTAIETHSRNHPEARHYLRDLAAADPIKLVPEGKLDLLMASPTCTHHSRARGGKPSSDQQRMDPWAIVRWCSELRVKRLLVENVPEFQEWGPLDLRTGRPIKRRKGEYFRAWAAALRGLGFHVDWRVLNAADFGDATTRVRFFLIGRSDGKRLQWPTPTHSRDGRLLGLKEWRPASDIIDWSIEGQSIYRRKRPLAAATLARIHAGAVKFRWPEPYLVVLRRHMAVQSLDQPLPALRCGGHVALAEPIVFPANQSMGRQRGLRSVADPLATITATGTDLALAEPFLLNRHGDNGGVRAHSLDEPAPTADCRGAGYLVEPFLLPQRSDKPARDIAAPVPTITTVARIGVVEPFMLSQASGGAPRGIDDPVPAIPTGGAHALIAPYYGSGSGESCHSTEEPLPTATAKARFGLVVPITHGDGSNRARSVDDPLPTITTAHRGELAVIVASHGEREGHDPRVHSIDDPCPTICATGRVQVAQPDPKTYDIRFRMLQPHELAAAMGFSDADAAYEFAGTKTEVTKQIGNAVPVNLARALVQALFGETNRDG